MSKSLIIAEKPSVALDISKALGGFKKVAEGNESYFESDTYVLSSAVGHLVELCLPGELDKKKGKWSFANLPVIPEEFGLKPIERSEGRLRLLKKLMKRPEVTSLINACDAGREGELIFRYIVDPGRDPRRLCAFAARLGTGTAGERRSLPVGKRLACGHQRHAGADGV
jgi:DNA topoisomerase-3